VDVDSKGLLDYAHLRILLSDKAHKTLVSLLAVNNEIGTLLDLQKTATICKEYKAFFHSDAVQAIGHFDMDLQRDSVDFITASAHKFHGPKGIGFAYFKKGIGIKPLLYGGGQEKGARAGTEAVHLIRGMQVALEISLKDLTTDVQEMQARKSFFIQELKALSPSIAFNGSSEDLQASTATILNVRLPLDSPFLLFQLDLKGIAVSGGSACQSGSNGGSHVLRELLTADEAQQTSLRFSFSKHTTKEELLYVVDVLKELICKEVKN
jgi:cysteine desulfurase